MGKSSRGPDVALMPGAAALALISGGSSAMTVIFSSMMEEGFGAAGWMSVAGAGAETGVVLVGLMFSLVVVAD
jgi:hypothetical protein